MYISGHPLCPVSSYRKYLSKLNPKRDDLWQRPADEFDETQDVWYLNQPLGKNTLAVFMKTISKQANLSREFTNHSIRATSISVLDVSKFTDRDIMSVSGHKSEHSIKNYTGHVTSKRKYEMSSALSASVTKDVEVEVHGELTLSQEQIDQLMEPMEIANSDVPLVNTVVDNVVQSEPQVIAEQTLANPSNVFDNVLKPIENLPFTPLISNCVVTFNVNLNTH